MKKEKFALFMFLFAWVGMLLFSSCEEKEEIVIPEVYFTYEGWFYVANGETLELKSFSIDEARSSDGVHINLVNYYFDGEKVASSASSPFGLGYLVRDKSVGEHELKIYVEVSGDGYADMKYTLNLVVYVLEKPFALDFDCYFDNEFVADKPTVSNGETFSGYIALAEDNTIEATITKVEYYWDGKLFGASSLTPFSFSYAVSNETAGKHSFKYVVTTDTDYGVFTTTMTRTVIVE